jgi:hypothetical protein
MSSHTEELAKDLKWGLLSARIQESLVRAMSEALRGQLTATKWDAISVVTGAVSVLSTPKLTPLPSQLDLELQLKAEFSIVLFPPAENAQNSSSMQELNE